MLFPLFLLALVRIQQSYTISWKVPFYNIIILYKLNSSPHLFEHFFLQKIYNYTSYNINMYGCGRLPLRKLNIVAFVAATKWRYVYKQIYRKMLMPYHQFVGMVYHFFHLADLVVDPIML